MIRLVYLIDTISCNTSGTEKQLLEMIMRLDKTKFEISLVCLWRSNWMRENELPCPLIVLGYEGFFKKNIFGVVIKLRKLIAENKIQIIQTFFEDSIFVAWLATRLNKLDIVLLSSRRDMGLGKGNQPWYHILFGMALPFVNKNFDGIIANCQQVKEYVVTREKTSMDKIEVVHNGVEFRKKTEKTPRCFVENLADIWIVIVASLTPVKRHDVLIKAVAILNQRLDRQKIKVLILGKGQERERLDRLVKQENVQHVFCFEGAVQNISDYLQHVDIGVLCSDREGLSNAVLEYMSSGLPVVVTAVGGNTELIDKKNGICVPPDDPDALADAVHELIVNKHKREQMGLVSRKKVEKYFSWQESMRYLEGYYQALLAEKRVISDK